MTVRVLDRSFDATESLLAASDTTSDYVVHGPRDGSAVMVSGEGDVVGELTALGLQVEVLTTRPTPETVGRVLAAIDAEAVKRSPDLTAELERRLGEREPPK